MVSVDVVIDAYNRGASEDAQFVGYTIVKELLSLSRVDVIQWLLNTNRYVSVYASVSLAQAMVDADPIVHDMIFRQVLRMCRSEASLCEKLAKINTEPAWQYIVKFLSHVQFGLVRFHHVIDMMSPEGQLHVFRSGILEDPDDITYRLLHLNYDKDEVKVRLNDMQNVRIIDLTFKFLLTVPDTELFEFFVEKHKVLCKEKWEATYSSSSVPHIIVYEKIFPDNYRWRKVVVHIKNSKNVPSYSDFLISQGRTFDLKNGVILGMIRCLIKIQDTESLKKLLHVVHLDCLTTRRLVFKMLIRKRLDSLLVETGYFIPEFYDRIWYRRLPEERRKEIEQAAIDNPPPNNIVRSTMISLGLMEKRTQDFFDILLRIPGSELDPYWTLMMKRANLRRFNEELFDRICLVNPWSKTELITDALDHEFFPKFFMKQPEFGKLLGDSLKTRNGHFGRLLYEAYEDFIEYDPVLFRTLIMWADSLTFVEKLVRKIPDPTLHAGDLVFTTEGSKDAVPDGLRAVLNKCLTEGSYVALLLSGKMKWEEEQVRILTDYAKKNPVEYAKAFIVLFSRQESSQIHIDVDISTDNAVLNLGGQLFTSSIHIRRPSFDHITLISVNRKGTCCTRCFGQCEGILYNVPNVSAIRYYCGKCSVHVEAALVRCDVCLEDDTLLMDVLPCGHAFCVSCVNLLREGKSTCPQCRASLKEKYCVISASAALELFMAKK